MLKRSTIRLLRFPFSYFLMPVYWFALSFIPLIHWGKAVLIFALIHLLVYPSSNGYNSYMDRDTGSIGGIKHPPAPEKELFTVTVAMDLLALGLSFMISMFFTGLLLLYIICSRLYSYRGIRLKKYPVIGYLTVILNQGAVVFLMVYYGAGGGPVDPIPLLGIIASCFLIGGFYPITQIYQHETDAEDGVRTLSMLLGKRSTFSFCALMYVIAFGFLLLHYMQQKQLWLFGVLQVFFIPVAIYFVIWTLNVWKNPEQANFENTMRMNRLAATCTSMAFISLIILQYFG